jgi:flagellar biosynthesis anti-sigma factor FlgM
MNIYPVGPSTNKLASDQNATPVQNCSDSIFREKLGVRTTLSSDSAAVGSLTAEAMTTPAIRHDKLAALQASVRNGSYSIAPREIAAALLQDLQ